MCQRPARHSTPVSIEAARHRRAAPRARSKPVHRRARCRRAAARCPVSKRSARCGAPETDDVERDVDAVAREPHAHAARCVDAVEHDRRLAAAIRAPRLPRLRKSSCWRARPPVGAIPLGGAGRRELRMRAGGRRRRRAAGGRRRRFRRADARRCTGTRPSPSGYSGFWTTSGPSCERAREARARAVAIEREVETRAPTGAWLRRGRRRASRECLQRYWLQRGGQRDFGNATRAPSTADSSCFADLRELLELRVVDARDLRVERQRDAVDEETVALLHEAYRGLGVDGLGLEARLVAGERERHREARGVRRAEELFGIGAALVAFEAARESVRIRRQCARFGADLPLPCLPRPSQ